MRSTCIIACTLLGLSPAPGCFKDEGSIGTAGDASASTSTSFGPTSTGSTSDPTSDSGGPSETSATSSGTEGTSGTTGGTTSDASTKASTTSGEPTSECGNGIVEGIEECDNGDENADDGLCTASCTEARCFDGLVQPILGEECDHGMLNHNNGACLENCKKAKCGDGHVFLGVEECDKGELNQADLYGGCTPMSCTLGPHCGDNEVQKPFEECDLGDKNGIDGEMCSDACLFNGKVVFVTSKTYTGLITYGGIKAADNECNTLAMAAGLPNAGAFRAWISDGESSPSKWDPPAGPFILLDSTIIAESWADLTDGTIAAAINIYETGKPLEETHKYAWTGTTPQGDAIEKNCEAWTKEIKDVKGIWGRLTATDGSWSNYSATECEHYARLICIEQ